MEDNKNEKPTGSKGFEQSNARGLVRCGMRGTAGATPPSSSVCYKIGTWNVRSLHQPGKMANTMKEMKRMSVDVLGVAETFWKGEGDFTTELPEDGETYRLIYSGGEKNCRGVGMILRGNVAKSVLD